MYRKINNGVLPIFHRAMRIGNIEKKLLKPAYSGFYTVQQMKDPKELDVCLYTMTYDKQLGLICSMKLALT